MNSCFFFNNFRKNQRNVLDIFSRNCNGIIKYDKYQKARIKLTNIQLNKLKSPAKNKTETILRINKKKIEDEELPHELFLIIRQTTKIRNVFGNKMSTDIKRSKAQISKIVQSDRSFGSWLCNLVKKARTNIAIPLARDNLPGLVSHLAPTAINKFERKNKWERSYESRNKICFNYFK